MLDKLRHLLQMSETQDSFSYTREKKVHFHESSKPPAPTKQKEVNEEFRAKTKPKPERTAHEEADLYLARIRRKMEMIAEEFATGVINRDQFQKLFDHYQRELRTIEAWLDTNPDSEAWRAARTEGKSIAIRRRNMARVLGYSIYKNDSGMPIATIGEFKLDAALIVPMLSSYRSATREIFGAGMRSTQIESGQWLCFVPGEITTLMALFSTEPAANQLVTLEDLHRLFERANRHFLHCQVVDSDKLVLPHQSFLKRRN
jgi:hypothetical protein